ncbi:MAG: DUF896 domain-containing protein [Bacillota bacterium]|nr:DUF896 domain-containing protein [Bacillota bacterium]
MDQKKIKRINELSQKAKTIGLTEEEKAEQQLLRNEYIAAFRASAINTLGNTYVMRPDGTKVKLQRREGLPS